MKLRVDDWINESSRTNWYLPVKWCSCHFDNFNDYKFLDREIPGLNLKLRLVEFVLVFIRNLDLFNIKYLVFEKKFQKLSIWDQTSRWRWRENRLSIQGSRRSWLGQFSQTRGSKIRKSWIKSYSTETKFLF